jgi:hypothetical protein
VKYGNNCDVWRVQTEPLDELSLKKLLLQFEKRLYRNQELRVKYPDMPEKYAVSFGLCLF